MSLLDATSTLILRMLKGYRDAQMAWLVCPEGSGLGAASGAQRWAPRRLAGGSSSSLGGSSAAGSLSALSSAADLAALQPQVEWEEAWGLDDASERRSDEQQGSDSGQVPEGEQQQQQQQEQRQRQQQEQRQQGGVLPLPPPQQPGAAGYSPERQQAAPAPRSPAQQGAGGPTSQLGALLNSPLLVIYAPRRAVVELWEPHSLSRVGSVACSTQLGLLLAQPVRRQHGGSGGGMARGSRAPNRCMLLDACSLTLTDLTDILLSSAV